MIWSQMLRARGTLTSYDQHLQADLTRHECPMAIVEFEETYARIL